MREAAGLTQEQAAQYVRRVGPLWTPTKVSDFERGRHDVSTGTLAAVSLAMTNALRDAEKRGVDVTVTARPADFMQSDGQVSLTSMGPDPLGPVLSAAFAGEQWPDDDVALLGPEGAAMHAAHEKVTTDFSGITAESWAEARTEHPIDDIKRKAGLAERRVAQRLGISMDELAQLSFERLGQSFTEARNARAGADASRQKRGRVARELEAQLREALNRGDR